MMTLLMSREALDGIPDFIALPQYSFERCPDDELQFAFQILVLGLKPVYSGSLDHRVNTLDLIQTREVLNTKKLSENIATNHLELMKEFISLESQLYSGAIKHGIWNRDYQSDIGSVPDAVEGS